LLADAIISADRLTASVEAIEDFNHLLKGRFKPAGHASRAANRRLLQILRALDGRRAGASYRDIAVVLFGPERVAKDWGDDGDHLKNHVRRLVKRGEVLVNGGYRRLLQR